MVSSDVPHHAILAMRWAAAQPVIPPQAANPLPGKATSSTTTSGLCS
jgi:hypothetical protein